MLLSTFAARAQTWQLVSGAPTNATAVGAPSGNTLFAGFGSSNGVYRSTDNGLTWSAANTGLIDSFGGAIPPTTLFRTSSGRILRGGPNASWNNDVGSPVYYSDTGTSWTQAPYPFATAGVNPGGVAASDFEEAGGALFFSDVLSFGVWKSTDNGVSWDKVDNGLPFAPFTGYKFARALAKSGGTLLTVDPIWGIYRTTDGGASWVPSRTGISPVASGILGSTWPANDITAAADGTVYAMVSSSLYKSTDAGQSWEDVGAGVFTGGEIRKLTTLGNSIYAAFSAAGGYQVYESTNAGAGWQLMPTNGLAITGLDVLATTFLGHNSALYLAGPQGLFRLDTTSAARIPIAPIFISGTGNIGVNLADSFTFAARYAGTTPISYQWYRNGSLLAGATAQNYIVASATTNDAGSYSVVAGNSGGSVTNTIGTLTVAPRSLGAADYSFAGGFGYADLFNWNGFVFTSAQVTSLARQPDGKAIVTGTFAYAGRAVSPVENNAVIRSAIVRINPDGTVDTSFSAGSGPNVAPDGVVLQPDGKILVSGEFSTWNGVAANRLVRLNPDGSLDRTFNIGNGPNARVYRAVVMPDGKIAICGTFTTFNGRYRGYLAMLNPDGSLAPGLGELYGANTYVFTIALQADGKLLAGGDFTKAELQTRNKVARFNADGTLDASFNPGNGPGGRVLHLRQLPDGRVFVGGSFNSRMTLLTSSGTTDATFAPANFNADVYASASLGTNYLAVGGDSGLLVVLNLTGATVFGGVSGSLATYGLAEEPDGRFLAASGSTFLTGRLSRFFGAAERFGIIRQPGDLAVNAGASATFSVSVRSAAPVNYQWLKNGSPLGGQMASNLTLNAVSSLDATNYSVVVTSGSLVVTSSVANLTVLGAPVIASGPAVQTVAIGYSGGLAVTALGQAPLSYQWKKNNVDVPGATNSFLNFAAAQLSDTASYSVVVSNAISSATSASAQFTATQVPGNLDLAWALTSNSGGVLTSLAPGPDGKLYVAGASGNKVYRFSTNGLVDNTFTATNLGVIGAMILQTDGKPLVAHGTNITRLNVNGPWDNTWTNRGFNGGISVVTKRLVQLLNGQILVFGTFTGYGGFASPTVVRLNADGSADTSYQPLPNAAIVNPDLFCATPDGTVFLATSFSPSGFSGSYQLHRLRPDGSRDAGYAPFFNGIVTDIQAAADGSVVVLGRFTTANGVDRPGFARLLPDGNLDPVFSVPFGNLLVNGTLGIARMQIQPNGKILLSGSFTSISNSFPAAGMARLNRDGSVDLGFSGINGAALVNATALFPDGRVAIGGSFSTANGVARANVAVLQDDLTDPAFVAPPVSQTVAAGANVTFSAGISSQSGVTYQWYRNGGLLAGQNNSTLTLTGVTLADAALYRVVATSAAGTNSSTAQLTVLGAPVITQQPVATEFWIGSTNSLSVTAIGQPTLNYQWTRDGSPVGTNALLTLTNAQTTDSGSYVVTITNSLGSTSSVPVQVSVITRPGLLITNWASAVPSGGSETFTDIEALADGRFLICGNELFGNAPYFARLNSDGTQDGTFNAGLATGVGTGNLGKMALLPNGQIYLQRGAAVQRHGTNGVLDGSFVFRGITGTLVPTIADLATAPDGKLLVAGTFLNYGGVPAPHLIRLFPDGSIDGGFSPAIVSNVTAVAVQPDGKILAATVLGLAQGAQLVRLLPDGSIDPSFNTNTMIPASSSVAKIFILPDGRIYVGGGFTAFGNAPGNGLIRLFSNGSRDFSFTTPVGTYAGDLAVQANGRVVVAGGSTVKGFRRYNEDGSLDAKFMLDNGAVSSGSPYCVAIDPTGRVLCGGNFNNWNIDNSHSYIRRGLALLNGDAIDLFIYQQPQPQFVPHGSPAMFNVGVTSAAPFTLQWQKDGTNLVGETGATLNITNAQTDTVGFYSVVAVGGGLSRTSSVAQLAVLGTPKITGEPKDQDAYYSETLQLNVGAEGAFPFGFQWRQDGVPLLNETNSVLFKTNLPFSAAGAYDVVVGNSFGSVTSQLAQVTVSLRPGSRNTDFAPGTGPNFTVQQLLTLADGRAYLVGGFSAYNGVNRRNVALVNPDGSLSTTFSNNANANSTVNAAAVQSDGKLVLGGSFTSWTYFSSPFPTFYSQYLIRFQTNGWIDTNFTANLNPGPNSTVSLLAVGPDDKILVSGNFTVFNDQPRTNLARLNADGTLDYGFQIKTNWGAPSALLVQPDNKILFGSSLYGMRRLNADGSVDAAFTAPAFNSTIATIALQPDGKVLVGGYFTTMAGQPNRYVTRLNPDGTLDGTFNSGTNVNSNVSGLAVQADGKILVSGSFTTVAGATRNYFTRLNSDGSLDTTFLPGAGPSGGSPANPLIGIQYDGRILLAGGFTSYDGASAPYFTAINGQTNTFAITNQPVARIVNAGANVSFSVGVFGAGGFTYQWFKNGSSMAGQTAPTLTLSGVQSSDAALYSVVVTSGLQTRTSRTAGLTVLGKPVFVLNPSSQLATQGSNVVFSGVAEGAATVNYQWQKNGAGLPGQTASSLLISGAGMGDAGIYVLVAANSFGSVTSAPAVLSVNLLPAGALDVSFGTNGPNSTVVQVVVDTNTGSVFIGGGFTQVDGKPRLYVAKLSTAGTLDTNFAAANPDSSVQTVALQPDGKLLIGGNFSTVGGLSRRGIARLNPNGALDLTFSNSLNANVLSIAVLTNGQVLAGGQFSTIDGITRSNLVCLNADGSVNTGWGATNMTSGYVQSISVQSDNRILIGGGFLNVLGTVKRQVARLNADGTLDAAFDVGNGPNINNSVQVVRALANGQVMVGGTFNSFNSLSRPYVVRLSNLGAVDTGFNASLSGSGVTDIRELPDGKLFVGGTFASGIMRFLTNGVPDTTFMPGSGVSFGAAVYTIALQPDGKAILGGSFTSYGGVFKPYLARILGDGPAVPAVTINPNSITATPGDNVFFAGIATGLNPLRFQWRKDGTNLVGETNIFLSLAGAQANAAGNYSVVVTNSAGSVTSLVATLSFNLGGAFNSWATSFNLPPGLNNPQDDADGDGIKNIFEYYFGSNPTNGASGAQPGITTVNVSGVNYPAITFIRSQGVSGVSLLPQVSSTLSFSNSLGATVASVVDLGNGTEQVTIRSNVSLGAQATQFLRIQLSIP